MRKKWLPAGIGFVIGMVMLFVSGFSAMASTSGYDTYKVALKNTKAVTSMVANVHLAVTDNGTKVFAAAANIKLNHERNASSVDGTFGDTASEHSVNVFRQDGKIIFKSGDSDVYRVKENNAPQQTHDGTSNPPKAVEQVIDALMGNLRELSTVENEADGGKLAVLHLSGSQIPAVVNALGSVVISKAADCDHWGQGSWNPDKKAMSAPSAMKVNIPKLTGDVTVKDINLQAKINSDQLMERQTAEFTVTGKDDSGVSHAVMVKLNVDFSGFNQTMPDRIELTGKQVEQIPNDGMQHGWKGHGWDH